jgi:hypothetical protein
VLAGRRDAPPQVDFYKVFPELRPPDPPLPARIINAISNVLFFNDIAWVVWGLPPFGPFLQALAVLVVLAAKGTDPALAVAAVVAGWLVGLAASWFVWLVLFAMSGGSETPGTGWQASRAVGVAMHVGFFAAPTVGLLATVAVVTSIFG